MLYKRVVLILLPNARRANCDLTTTLLTTQNTFFKSKRSFSLKRNTVEEQSFTVSYLISSCGLSPETALIVSQKVQFQSADRPDSVLTLLRNHGFTNAHISKIARTRPDVLISDPENTLFPKLEFFKSIGIPNADLANITSFNPTLLFSSLNNRLIPVYNYLKGVILLDDKQVRQTFKCSSWVFGSNLEKQIVPKIEVLRELGVPAANLSVLISTYSFVVLRNPNQFDKAVKGLVEMGFNPSELKFVCALQIILRLSKSKWEHKMEVYRKFGWSEDDFHLAFKKQPLCMSMSEKKILNVMDFLVNEMGWMPTAIARVPSVLLYSVKKRTIPRCLVVKVLIVKGLIEKDVSFCTVLIWNDKRFLDKFVNKYEEHVPLLLDIFNGKLGLAELGFDSGEIRRRKVL